MSKKALLVGINQFVTLPENTLHGCVNDVLLLRGVLTTFYGFLSDEITILIDHGATYNAIFNALAQLITGAQPGDVLVFHFSGHGTQVADRDGDEDDGADECLVPTDHNWNDPLRDDQLRIYFERIPAGVSLTFIADCCHSGTIQRDLAPVGCARLINYPRRIIPPPWIQAEIAACAARKRQQPTRDFQFAPYANHILLAACRDDETAADAYINSRYQGAFTWALCQALANSGGTITYQEAMRQAGLLLNDYGQHPQLECPPGLADRPIFSSI